jgi:membrane fusion protein, multidrug efflux system
MSDDPRSYQPPEPGRRFTRGFVMAAVGVAIVAGGIVVAHRLRLRHEGEARATEAKKGRLVTAGELSRTPEEIKVRLPGEVHGYTETPVYAKVAGYLKSIAVDKGDRVDTGQVLAVLESPELVQQVRNAQANADLRRATDQRYQALRKSGVVSQQDADQARADALQAAATLKQLQAQQGYLNITAEFDGVVTARYADPGTLIPQSTGGGVGASTPILAMTTLSPLRVYVDLPQSDARYVKDGDQAVVTVAEFGGRKFTGAVTRHPQALAPGTRTMLVEVDLPNEDRALLPGMYAQVEITLTGRTSAIRVPDDILIFRDGKTWVPVIDGDKLRVVEVRLGYDDGRASEVVEGLRGDERLAMNVGQTGRDGEPIRVHEREQPAGTPPAH